MHANRRTDPNQHLTPGLKLTGGLHLNDRAHFNDRAHLNDRAHFTHGCSLRGRAAVVCTYTHRSYDATTTLQSKAVFRIDQQTQGGLAHVIRGPERTLVWIEGMTEAMEFDTDAYEHSNPELYPRFDPAEFDLDTLFADGTCRPDSAAEDAVFELPDDMTSAPATP